MAQPPESEVADELGTFQRTPQRLSTPQTTRLCEPVGSSMSRGNGGAVWSNCPRTDLVRAPAGKPAGATLQQIESIIRRSACPNERAKADQRQLSLSV